MNDTDNTNNNEIDYCINPKGHGNNQPLSFESES